MTEYKTKQIIKISHAKAGNDNEITPKEDVSFLHYIKVCFWDKFSCFKGRARRKEYLAFQCVDVAVACLFYSLLRYTSIEPSLIQTIYTAVSVLFLVPLLSVTVRRFHDVGLSAWWCLSGVVPYAAIIFLSIKESDRETNKYGAVPLGKIFGPSIFARFIPAKETSVADNVVEFATQEAPAKRKRKTTKKVA